MLARQGSLQYAIKKQAVIAELAQNDERLMKFFKGLRATTLLGAVGTAGAAIVLAIMSIGSILSGTAINGAFSFVIVAALMVGAASLTIATEGPRAKCVARFFGFMSLNVWKGLYSVFCGLFDAWIGMVYKVYDNYSPGATTFDTVLFWIGIVNVLAGVAWMVFGGCNFVGNGTTPLKEEFANYAAAMRMFQEIERKERQTGTEQVTVTIKRQTEGAASPSSGAAAWAAAAGGADGANDAPPNPFAAAVDADAGGGEANPFKKKPAEKTPFDSKPAAAAAVDDNPFRKPKPADDANPFS